MGGVEAMSRENRFLHRFPEFADLPRPRSDGPGEAYQLLPPSIRRRVERLVETYAATVEWSCRFQDHEITFDEFCTLTLNRSHARDQLVDFIASILPGRDTVEPVDVEDEVKA